MALIGRYRKIKSRWESLLEQTKKNGLRPTIFMPNGDQYRGEWKDNLKDGRGVQVWKSGLKYDGEWRQNMRHGYGLLLKKHPATRKMLLLYKGEWKNDKKDGRGLYYYSSSSAYSGLWVGGCRCGYGEMIYNNGDVYKGEWLRDKPNGKGVLYMKNGNVYEGEMMDGMKHGHGMFHYKDRQTVYEGFWVKDVAKCGTLYKNTQHTNTVPQVMLQDVHAVMEEAVGLYQEKEEEPC